MLLAVFNSIRGDNIPMSKKNTLAEEYQNLLYSLFQKGLFSLEGIRLKNEKGLDEEFISRTEFIDSAISVLNELGELMSTDERLNKE